MHRSSKSKQRRSQPPEPVGRGHVRAARGAIQTEDPPQAPPLRMTPLSQARAGGTVSVAERRAERRQRKQRAQAHKAPPVARRRRSVVTRVFSWRAVSGLIVVGLVVVLYLFLTADAFYVTSVAIGGEKYLTREEIFRDSGIATRHLFWIDPADVEQRLEMVPNIAAAQVFVGWPPDSVQIIVTEREPALIWEQQGVRVWVDVNGIVMKQREDRPDLLRIVVPSAPEPISIGALIPQTIVDGALYLRNRHPNIDVLLYDPVKGLGYHDGGGWTVWFGTGQDMETKLLVYYQLVKSIESQVQPGEIIVTDPDRPWYTVLWRKTNG
jgi:hypothetical protein